MGENKTIGIVASLAGVVTFLYSFGENSNYPTAYFVVGLILLIGGLFFAKYAKD